MHPTHDYVYQAPFHICRTCGSYSEGHKKVANLRKVCPRKISTFHSKWLKDHYQPVVKARLIRAAANDGNQVPGLQEDFEAAGTSAGVESPELQFAPTPVSFVPSCCLTDADQSAAEEDPSSKYSGSESNGRGSSCTDSQSATAIRDLQELQRAGFQVRWPCSVPQAAPTGTESETTPVGTGLKTRPLACLSVKPESEHTRRPGEDVPSGAGQDDPSVELAELEKYGWRVTWPN